MNFQYSDVPGPQHTFPHPPRSIAQGSPWANQSSWSQSPWTTPPPPWSAPPPGTIPPQEFAANQPQALTLHPDQSLKRQLDSALRKIHEYEDALLHHATLSRYFFHSLKTQHSIICPDCKQEIAHTCISPSHSGISPSVFQPPMGSRDHRPPSNLGRHPTGFQTAQGNTTFGEPVPSAPNHTRFETPPRSVIPVNPTNNFSRPSARRNRANEYPNVRFASPVTSHFHPPPSPSSSDSSTVFIPSSPDSSASDSGFALLNRPATIPNTNQGPEQSLSPRVALPHLRQPPSPVPIFWRTSEQESEAVWSTTYTTRVRREVDVDSVRSLQIGSEPSIRSLKFSDDGKTLAVGYDDTGMTNVYDLQSGEKISTMRDTIDGKDVHISSVCFSPDGLHLATVGSDGIVRIWEIPKKRIRNIFKFPPKSISCIDFSPDGRHIALGLLFSSEFGLGSLHVWNWRDGSRKISENSVPHINDIRFSPDGQDIAIGVDSGVLLWNVRRRSAVPTTIKHGDVDCVAFMPNGMGLVSGSRDGTVKLWSHRLLGLDGPTTRRLGNGIETENSSQKDLLIFRGHKSSVRFVAVSSNCRWVVSCSYADVCVWSADDAELHCKLRRRSNESWFDFSPVHDCLATSSKVERSRVLLRRIRDV